MQHGLSSVREIKVLGREREFVDDFGVHADGARRKASRQAIVDLAPRSFFKPLAIMPLIVLVTTLVLRVVPVEPMAPLLGLFASVAFRLLPTVNHAAASIQRLRGSAGPPQ